MSLEQIFEMQHALNEHTRQSNGLPLFAEIKESIEEREKWVLNYLRAMQQEISEAIDETSWKWWKAPKPNLINEAELKIELVDVLHFWVSACIMLGMEAEDVFRIYKTKNEVNYERQKTKFQKKNSGIKDDEHAK